MRIQLALAIYLGTLAAPGFTRDTCSPPSEPAATNGSAHLWELFERNYRSDPFTGAPRPWLAGMLQPADLAILRAGLSGHAHDSQVGPIVEKLPVPAVLAWHLACGRASAATTAFAAHSISDAPSRRAVLAMLVQLPFEHDLAVALAWTLRSDRDRETTADWYGAGALEYLDP